ncbi:SLBB domain protein [Pirellulimonas nuda]|uniref:SLBB domain protein n=1 Tax=Pirellulimonas nuda TaxID=2528009 RepID=A0A518D7E0_9BACT|nr:SLBB domain-containing protein [Pirellulimonas nuda]QDU87400.1 SLBB domain protein [Pirellulimonas nuda]
MAAAVLLSALAGCQSGGFRAANLPPELIAQPTTGLRQMKLGTLATSGNRGAAIAPGDLLAVRVVSGAEASPPEPFLCRVSDAGIVETPVIGAVNVVDLEPSDAATRIAAAAVERSIYRQPQVTVEFQERATNRVTVLGAVSEPGVHEIPRGACDVVAAIAAAGGMTESADFQVEVLRRSQPQPLASAESGDGSEVQQASFAPPSQRSASYPEASQPSIERLDLADTGPGAPRDRPLGDGDVLMVIEKEKRFIHITGLVAKPDQIELPVDQDIRLLDAVAMAGGKTSPVADKAIVIRQVPGGGEPVVINVSLNKAKVDGRENLLLAPNDLVSVENTPATAALQTVKDFVRVTMGVSGGIATF